MNCSELIRNTAQRFQEAGIPDPVNDAALLLSHLTGRPPLQLRLDDVTAVSIRIINAYEALVCKRLSRIPLQYLLGEAPFFGRFFAVDPRVLIPRPETELLCEWALEELTDTPGPRILDLCCGSGCIGITLKSERPDASVILSDISPDALSLARENAVRLSAEVSFCRSDLLDIFRKPFFNLIISNPPYIPSADCDTLQPEVLQEPRLALDGGTDGLSVYRRIVPEALNALVPGGLLMMEMGIDEDRTVAGLLKVAGFRSIQVREDYAGIRRMIMAVKP